MTLLEKKIEEIASQFNDETWPERYIVLHDLAQFAIRFAETRDVK